MKSLLIAGSLAAGVFLMGCATTVVVDRRHAHHSSQKPSQKAAAHHVQKHEAYAPSRQ